MRKLVKQLDFLFRDGAEGSLFIVTRVSSLISQKMLIDMVLAFILILIFTSMVLTNWIQRGVFTPVNQLNTAMQQIAEGNLEYRLSNEEKGEIGELYRNNIPFLYWKNPFHTPEVSEKCAPPPFHRRHSIFPDLSAQ